jgi:hypothetical protein
LIYALVRIQNEFPGFATINGFVLEKQSEFHVTDRIFDGNHNSLSLVRRILDSGENPPRVCMGLDMTAISTLRLKLSRILHRLREVHRGIGVHETQKFFQEANSIGDLLNQSSYDPTVHEIVVMALSLAPGSHSTPVVIFSTRGDTLNEERYDGIQCRYDCKDIAHDADCHLLCPACVVLQRMLISFSPTLNNPLQFSVFMEESEIGNEKGVQSSCSLPYLYI